MGKELRQGDIKPGFMGYAAIGNQVLLINSFSFNAEQDIQFYDHTVGLRDSVPTTLNSTKGDTSWYLHPQKSIYRPGVIAINGTLDATMDDTTCTTLFNYAKKGDTIDALQYIYNCKLQRTFKKCRINTFTLSASAGDVVKTNASFLALDLSESQDDGTPQTNSSKIVTFDKVGITCYDIDAPIITFSMTINNSAAYVYSAGTNLSSNLLPKEIRMGVQDVRGTMTFYTKGVDWKHVGQTVSTINVVIGTLSFKLQCMFLPIKRDGAVGAIVSTLPFIGVGSYWL